MKSINEIPKEEWVNQRIYEKSNCCGAGVYSQDGKEGICMECKEPCTVEKEIEGYKSYWELCDDTPEMSNQERSSLWMAYRM